MSLVGFLPVHLQGFYGWLIFVRSWIYFFGRHFGFSYVCCRFWVIYIGVRVFANGPGDLCSIPGRVIPKTQKMVLDASLLSTQHYKVWIKGKIEQSWKGVAPSPTHWCSSYRKGSLRVTLDYGRQLYLYILYIIYIYIYIIYYIYMYLYNYILFIYIYIY